MSFSLEDGPEIDVPEIDKLVHFSFYFVALLLGGLWIEKSNNLNRKPPVSIKALGFILFFYGIIIEVLQSILPTGRSAEVLDGLANTFGILTGILALRFILKKA